MNNHPNKTHFVGILCPLDAPTDEAPMGARGHRVILAREEAEKALPSLIGMGVNFAAEGGNHFHKSKHGIISKARIVKDGIRVWGYLFGHDCPEVVQAISACAEDWGMSYELGAASVEDMHQFVWQLREVTFTGAAILPRVRAAYSRTSFHLEP